MASSRPITCRASSAPGNTRWQASGPAKPTCGSVAPYKVNKNDVSAFRVEVAKRMSAFNESAGLPGDWPVPATERAGIRTEVAREFFTASARRRTRCTPSVQMQDALMAESVEIVHQLFQPCDLVLRCVRYPAYFAPLRLSSGATRPLPESWLA